MARSHEVTGRSRGIGETIALVLAEAGAGVALHSRDADAANTVKDRIATTEAHATVVLGDVTSADDLARMADEIESTLRRSTSWWPTPVAIRCGPGRSKT